MLSNAAPCMIEYFVLTQFPHLYKAYIREGLPKRAVERNIFRIETIQLRDFADPARKGRIDDAPYGGGPGMIMQIAPLHRALDSVAEKSFPVVLLTPQGTRLTQQVIAELKQLLSNSPPSLPSGLTIISGYYQGIDARVEEHLIDYSISIGDFTLGSGDLAALVLIEALNRLLPNYMNSPASLSSESAENGSLEFPQYTRPAQYREWSVPPVLLSGHEKAIHEWRAAHRPWRSFPEETPKNE